MRICSICRILLFYSILDCLLGIRFAVGLWVFIGWFGPVDEEADELTFSTSMVCLWLSEDVIWFSLRSL